VSAPDASLRPASTYSAPHVGGDLFAAFLALCDAAPPRAVSVAALAAGAAFHGEPHHADAAARAAGAVALAVLCAVLLVSAAAQFGLAAGAPAPSAVAVVDAFRSALAVVAAARAAFAVDRAAAAAAFACVRAAHLAVAVARAVVAATRAVAPAVSPAFPVDLDRIAAESVVASEECVPIAPKILEVNVRAALVTGSGAHSIH
jgi:hypothetical protein